ncbi:MAG: efflux RND transporter periplasmic adaptor subunit [Alphaproteobacteria bacterium]|nr:efflux RND transporter periplasmic adaptor subunit [Alphaproteobacteria bacterium]
MKYKIAYILIAIIAVAAAVFVLRDSRLQKDKTALDELHFVTVAPVVLHEFRDNFNAVGTLKAQTISLLSPKIAGTITSVIVDIGDKVKSGEAVIKLDNASFKLVVKQTRATLIATETAVSLSNVQFRQAKREYNRAVKLIAEKTISQSNFETVETAYETSQKAVSSAKAQHNQAKATLGLALENLKNTSVCSPIDGIVVERNAEIGQGVASGMILLRIVNQTSLRTDINLPEIDFERISKGIPAVITVDSFSKQEFYGKVTVINPMIDQKTRTFRVRIEISNPSEKLVDGMFVRVKLSAKKRMTLAVPRTALQHLSGSGTFYVFVINKNKAFKRAVKIGATNNQYAEVLEGLTKNEKVVTSGAGKLRSGVKVNVQQKE